MEEASAPAGEEPKTAIWTSLEVSKLLLSALTPIALFGLGLIVANSTSEEATRRDKSIREEARADQAAAEARAVVRETANRDSARRDARQASDLAFERDKALRAEAFARELAMRREAEARDLRVRMEAGEESRRSRMLDRRIEVWNQLSQIIRDIHEQLYTFIISNSETVMPRDQSTSLIAKHGSLISLMQSYARYFSTEFRDAFHLYHQRLDLVDMHIVNGRATSNSIREDYDCLDRLFANVTGRAQVDIEDTPGPGGNDAASVDIAERCLPPPNERPRPRSHPRQ